MSLARTFRASQMYLAATLLPLTVLLAGCGSEPPVAPDSPSERQPSGSGADPVPSQQVEFTGTVSSLSSNTPGATLVVAGRTVRTNAGTLVRRRGDPVSFDRLAVGQVVEVEGAPQADGSVLAARITIEDEPNAPAPPPAPEVDVRFEGTLTAKSGNAASGTLTVAGRTVQTDGTTDFRRNGSGTSHVTFDALQVGQRLDVRGTQQSNNTVRAQRVTIEN